MTQYFTKGQLHALKTIKDKWTDWTTTNEGEEILNDINVLIQKIENFERDRFKEKEEENKIH